MGNKSNVSAADIPASIFQSIKIHDRDKEAISLSKVLTEQLWLEILAGFPLLKTKYVSTSQFNVSCPFCPEDNLNGILALGALPCAKFSCKYDHQQEVGNIYVDLFRYYSLKGKVVSRNYVLDKIRRILATIENRTSKKPEKKPKSQGLHKIQQ